MGASCPPRSRRSPSVCARWGGRRSPARGRHHAAHGATHNALASVTHRHAHAPARPLGARPGHGRPAGAHPLAPHLPGSCGGCGSALAAKGSGARPATAAARESDSGAGFSPRRTKAARRQRAPPASPLRARAAAAAAAARGPGRLRRPLAPRCPLRGRSDSRAPARCCPPPPPPSGYRTAHINYSSPVSSFPGEANHRQRLR